MKITIDLSKTDIAYLQGDEDGRYLEELRGNAAAMINQFFDNNRTGSLKKAVMEEA